MLCLEAAGTGTSWGHTGTPQTSEWQQRPKHQRGTMLLPRVRRHRGQQDSRYCFTGPTPRAGQAGDPASDLGFKGLCPGTVIPQCSPCHGSPHRPGTRGAPKGRHLVGTGTLRRTQGWTPPSFSPSSQQCWHEGGQGPRCSLSPWQGHWRPLRPLGHLWSPGAAVPPCQPSAGGGGGNLVPHSRAAGGLWGSGGAGTNPPPFPLALSTGQAEDSGCKQAA